MNCLTICGRGLTSSVISGHLLHFRTHSQPCVVQIQKYCSSPLFRGEVDKYEGVQVDLSNMTDKPDIDKFKKELSSKICRLCGGVKIHLVTWLLKEHEINLP